MSDAEFDKTADYAVRLAVDAQVCAGVDVLTDGEQRRDNYASFVGGLLENCQLVPVTDLLPYVDGSGQDGQLGPGHPARSPPPLSYPGLGSLRAGGTFMTQSPL